METKIVRLFVMVFVAIAFSACPKGKTAKTISVNTTKTTPQLLTPTFNPDSAYHYISTQVEFGPRVPNSKAHRLCGDYLIMELKRFGAQVTIQEADLKAYDNTIYKSRNIIGSYQANKPSRILLCAHWDTRHVADNEPDKTEKMKPIDGANDGASGVGVLLEIARQLNQAELPFGVDIIFFDAEDQGRPSFLPYDPNSSNTWCLGSQYWSKNPHKTGYSAEYGILLDMVGAADAIFPMEGYSMQFAPNIVNKVWNLASNMNYSNYFVFERSAPVTDDHYFVNTIAGIPCIDIIHYHPSNYKGFGDFWHTHNDNMDIISKPTLNAVGSVLLEHLYQQPF